VQLAVGRRKLKRVFMDRKIGRSRRSEYPVLVDQKDVLWVVDLVRSARAPAKGEREVFSVWLRRAG
jgi:tRNA(Ile)-lysidine synthetase-like protein